MDTEPGVQRMFRLGKDRFECVGALVDGYVEGLTSPEQAGKYTAFLSVAETGPDERRVHPDGRVFYHSQFIGEAKRSGYVTDSMEGAIAELARMKAQMLAEGWIEDALDPVNDPD